MTPQMRKAKVALLDIVLLQQKKKKQQSVNEDVDFRYSTMPSVIYDHFHVSQMSYWKKKITKLTFFTTFTMRKRDAPYQW